MKKQRIKAKVKDLVLNEGQLGWLPKNPRQWTQDDIDKTKKSLTTDPDFQEDNPIKVVPFENKLLVFAGNLRTTSAKSLKWDTFEAMLYTPETDEDRETIKRRAILDNGQFGAWDVDALANDWDNGCLNDWGVPDWVTGGFGNGGGEGERKPGSRPGGKGDVNTGFAFAVRVEFETAEDQIEFLAEMEERGLKATAV